MDEGAPVNSATVVDDTKESADPKEEKDVKRLVEVLRDNKKKNNMAVIKEAVVTFVKRASLVVMGYTICYLQWSLLLPFLAIGSLVWLETHSKATSRKIKNKAIASSLTKYDLAKKLEEFPSWVTFPDRERAEWLNEIILQLWPSLCNFTEKLFRTKIQAKLKKKVDSFMFEEIDFGPTPPKIDGVKVYNRNVTKDSVIIDFDIFYDGNCNITFSMKGTEVGRIKDFQMGVEVRVVLKPILVKMPIVGGMQIFFLNQPDLNFELEGISAIPGFSYLVRQKIESVITKKIVFPNKIAKRFTKTVEASELKALEPEGVLRVHVFEGRDLEKKDVTGKSDPYVILKVGGQECTSPVVKKCLNPKWDYWCEFVVLDPAAQQLKFELYDQDELNEDDFMGRGFLDISDVIRDGKNDIWVDLLDAKHGKIHLRFTWLGLTADISALEMAMLETKQLQVADVSTALLCVYVDCAENLPKCKSLKKPDVYLILTVGKNQQKSRVKKRTTDPNWEQGFCLLVNNPETDSLIITIHDKHTDGQIDQLVYNINQLATKDNMQISKEDFPLPKAGHDSKIIISLQLRILTNALFEDEDSESDLEDDQSRGRHNSVRSNVSTPSHISNVSRQQSQIEEPIQETVVQSVNASPTMSKNHDLQRSPSIRSYAGKDKGQIELTIEYSELRQKLIVTVHRIANLPLKDPHHIPDPYVKLKLTSTGNSAMKNKTRVIMDNCDPVFDETFEYLLSMSEIQDQRLIVTVKTYKKLSFAKKTMGQVVINFTNLNLEYPYRSWHDLGPEQYSD